MQLDKMMNSEQVYRSSRQLPNRKIVKQTVFPIRAKSALRHDDDKLESTSSATQTYGDLRCGRRGHADIGIMGRSKVLGSNQQPSFKVQERKDDELVKYMSNLPGYLQHVEREVQDSKVLNFGVLDWARLQKWKEKHAFIPATDGYNASASSSHLAAKNAQRSSKPRTAEHREVLYRQNEQHHCPCSRPNTSSGDHLFRDAKPSIRNMAHFEDLEAASNSRMNGQTKLQSTHKQSSKNCSEPIVSKGNRQEFDLKIDSSKLKSRPDVSTRIRRNGNDDFYDSQFKRRMESKKELGIKKKDLDLNVTSSTGVVSTAMRNYDVFPSSKGKKNAAEATKVAEKLQESFIDIPSYFQGSDKKNIVLLVPTESTRNSSSECSSTSFGENSTDADRDSSSDCLTFGEPRISEHESRVPQSCPLPSGADTNKGPQSIATKSSQGMVLSSDTPQKYVRAKRMLVMPSASDGIKTLNQNAEPSKVMDQETAELVIQKGRHPSPNRRFSFSLGRMTRSFSFKESSGGPELSSTDSSVKSGPVTTKSSSFPDSSREKAAGNSRSRSSPLKRFLEPLLKSKSINPQHSAGNDRPQEGSLKSVSFKPSQAFDSQSGNHGKSRIQAVMDLVVANGRPVFRFVVDNDRTFMATIKSSASPKEEPKCNFTFYSVDEIRKKRGNWINQGSREKNVNLIGHMKVRSSLPDRTGQNSTGESWAKECVLYGVELRQVDKPSPVFVPSGELAALVLTSPGNDEEVIGNGFSDCLPEDGKYCDEVTAILPGAIHSLPSKGAPSPLIQRWKTGGFCDCGGWDIGCKLQILKNQRQSSKTPRTFTAYPKRECFELFVQGEAHQDKAIFSLFSSEKGLYSIEFSQSISLLQAFFISVTVTNFQTSSDLPQLSNLKEKILWERKNATKKIPESVLQVPILKFTQGPPLSPIGRV